MRKSIWPKNKTLPVFASVDEEVAFWHRYEVAVMDDKDGWEEVPAAETVIPARPPKDRRGPLRESSRRWTRAHLRPQ